MKAYYNDVDPFCCKVLRKQISLGNLPPGNVDERDIRDVTADELKGYGHVHLFAGIGGFPLGFMRAGVPDDWRIVTGGFPCQDISNAGKRVGIEGRRSGLWSEFARVVREIRPSVVVVENVAALLGCNGGGLAEFSETWPESGLMLNGRCYRRALWVRHTHVKECFSLPTPTKSDGGVGEILCTTIPDQVTGKPRKVNANGQTWSAGLGRLFRIATEKPLHPIFSEWMNGFPTDWTELGHAATPSSPKSPNGSAAGS